MSKYYELVAEMEECKSLGPQLLLVKYFIVFGVSLQCWEIDRYGPLVLNFLGLPALRCTFFPFLPNFLSLK